MDDLYISMQYNDREFEGISDFKSELDAEYNFQLRPKWLPSSSEGAEFWMTIFVNCELKDFLIGVVASGFIWDLIKVGAKKYVFTPLFKALEKLNKKNEPIWGGIKILKFKFQFDDCEIFIGGLNKSFVSVVSTVFNEITKKKPKFEREVGLEIIKIELPIIVDKLVNTESNYRYSIETYIDDYTIETFKKLWKLTFATNFPIMIYDFDKDELIEI